MNAPAAKTAAAAPAPEPGLITTKQMRELHAALRDFGVTGDATTHAYIARALQEMGADPVESRTELTTVQAAHIIADLEAAPPPPPGPSASAVRKLRAPFTGNEVGKLPRSTCRECSKAERKVCEQHRWVRCDVCGGSHSTATMHIDFVGHADVTSRLLDVDPEWSWRPWSTEELNALPPPMRDGLWIWLRVCGVERPGFGSGEGGQQRGPDVVKVAIGDALRNAGMRFGIALDLWAKGDRDWSEAAKDEGWDNPPMDPPAPRQSTPEQAPKPPPAGPTVGELLAELETQRLRIPEETRPSWEAFTAAFRHDHGDVSVEAMGGLHPRALQAFYEQVSAYIDRGQRT